MPGPVLDAKDMVGNKTDTSLFSKAHGLQGRETTVTSVMRMMKRERQALGEYRARYSSRAGREGFPWDVLCKPTGECRTE